MKERVMYTIQTQHEAETVRKTLDRQLEAVAKNTGYALEKIRVFKRKESVPHEQAIEIECILLAIKATLESLGEVYKLYGLDTDGGYKSIQKTINRGIEELNKVRIETDVLMIVRRAFISYKDITITIFIFTIPH